MRVHFWLILALSAATAAAYGGLLLEFPDREVGTTAALKTQQLYVWTQTVCVTGVYGGLVACILSRAWAGRWRFWATIFGSTIYLYVAGGVLVATLLDGPGMPTTGQAARSEFALFIVGVATVLYAVWLTALRLAVDLRRSAQLPPPSSVACATCGGTGQIVPPNPVLAAAL